jgi:ribosomal protein S27AE
VPSGLAASALQTELGQLERRLHSIDEEMARLLKEKVDTQHHLERLRLQLTMCPKCGRDSDFLTDEGGVLIHVLEDARDTDLLSPGKPLYCPGCGDVFLYSPPMVAQPTRRSKPKSR